MSSDEKEKLSQLMDGEWQDINTTKSVEAACADDDLKCKWSRYHLIRDVMRNDKISVDASLTARISKAIEDEPSYSNISEIGPRSGVATGSVVASSDAISSVTPPNHAEQNTQNNQKTTTHNNAWKTGLGGLAVAASVAMATVVGLNVWQGAPQSSTNVQTLASTPSTSTPSVVLPGTVLPEVEFVSNRGSYWVTPEAKRSAFAEKRLNMMLSNHIEKSPTAERSGMLPYSRLVGYDSVAPE